MREIEWDIDDLQPHGLEEIIDTLRGDVRRVYRAHLSIGTPVDSLLQPITRLNSPENDRDFTPDTLSISIGPVKVASLGSDDIAHVGWISVNLSGYGYLYPWTIREVVDRLEATPEIRRLADLCRTFWPVPPAPPRAEVVAARGEMGDLWPYDQADKEWDWYWGVQESG